MVPPTSSHANAFSLSKERQSAKEKNVGQNQNCIGTESSPCNIRYTQPKFTIQAISSSSEKYKISSQEAKKKGLEIDLSS
mmetsp:Transcript_36998/g.35716  ORF Transcript_36998/g.35716 Transcript_36998/m.35716 type:complete len:80 (+) Transcript_36998:243-482(+)